MARLSDSCGDRYKMKVQNKIHVQRAAGTAGARAPQNMRAGFIACRLRA